MSGPEVPEGLTMAPASVSSAVLVPSPEITSSSILIHGPPLSSTSRVFGTEVLCLAAGKGQVWGGIGKDLVTWGRE